MDQLPETIKKTQTRIALLEILESSKVPMTAQEIYESLKSRKIATDRSTVFRNTKKLAHEEILDQIDFGDGKFRYEIKEKSHHHHLVCKSCGSVTDIKDNELHDHIVRIVKNTRIKQKFFISEHKIEFFGTCKNCNK